MKKAIKLFSFLIIILFSFVLTSCQSVEKKAYMGTGDYFVCTCNYVESENKTYLKIKSYIQNDSMYKISKVTIKMNLYLGDNLVKKMEN